MAARRVTKPERGFSSPRLLYSSAPCSNVGFEAFWSSQRLALHPIPSSISCIFCPIWSEIAPGVSPEAAGAQHRSSVAVSSENYRPVDSIGSPEYSSDPSRRVARF